MTSLSPDSQKPFEGSRIAAVVLITAGMVWFLLPLISLIA